MHDSVSTCVDMRHHRIDRSMVSAIYFFAIISSLSEGKSPLYEPRVSDKGLAGSKIVVIAKWPIREMVLHGTFLWSPTLKDTVFNVPHISTSIDVLHVLKGSIASGKSTLVVPCGLFFAVDRLNGKYTVWDGIPGKSNKGVEDITVPCIWFLSIEESRSDGKDTPILLNIRGIQPMSKKRYFLDLIEKVKGVEKRGEKHD